MMLFFLHLDFSTRCLLYYMLRTLFLNQVAFHLAHLLSARSRIHSLASAGEIAIVCYHHPRLASFILKGRKSEKLKLKKKWLE